MALLRVRCAKCAKLVSTGLDMSYETFQSATLMEHVLECPNCEQTITWTVDDVDRSVFKPEKR
jgi:endogenous inhibitor of DNA gyrase (YacG/DUF329 family)